jgi:hypothetical protein
LATRPRRIDLDVQAEIEDKAADRWGPAQIERWLNDQEKYGDRVPTLRTIQRIAKEVTPRDKTKDWSLADTSSEEAFGVLGALRETIMRTHGTVKWFSQGLADWFVRVQSAGPGLRTHAVFFLATSYLRAQTEGTSTQSLDAFLAFAPWGQGCRPAYDEAVRNGWIPAAPLALLKAMEQDLTDEPGVYEGGPFLKEAEGGNG